VQTFLDPPSDPSDDLGRLPIDAEVEEEEAI
jgi:hypothetical protein